jgi:TRAP-type mannitol/chloroaromatic compound transport system permease large subunit
MHAFSGPGVTVEDNPRNGETHPKFSSMALYLLLMACFFSISSILLQSVAYFFQSVEALPIGSMFFLSSSMFQVPMVLFCPTS